MGEDDKKFLDLRGLVPDDRGRESPVKHSIEWSYGPPPKPQCPEIPTIHASPIVAAPQIPPIMGVPRSHSRRKFLRYAGLAVGAAGLAGVGIHMLNGNLDDLTREQQILVLAPEKLKRDWDNEIAMPLAQGRIVWGWFPSQLYKAAKPQDLEPYKTRSGESTHSDDLLRVLVAVDERHREFAAAKGQSPDDKLVQKMPCLLDKIRFSKVSLRDPRSLAYSDLNNPALARMQIGETVCTYLEKNDLVKTLYQDDQDVVAQHARDARVAQLIVPRMYQPDAHAFYGMYPQEKNLLITVDQAHHLYPLMLAGMRNGLEEMLDPELFIKSPKNDMEKIVVSRGKMSYDSFVEMEIHSANRSLDANALKNGGAVAQAAMDGDRIAWRNPRNTEDPAYDPDGSTDPSVTAFDLTMFVTGMEAKRDGLVFLQTTGVAKRYQQPLQHTIDRIDEYLNASAHLMAGMLDMELEGFRAWTLKRLGIGPRGLLPTYVYLPGGRDLEYQDPDASSTARAIGFLRRQGMHTIANTAYDRLAALTVGNLRETRTQFNPIAGLMPPLSRGPHTEWVNGWMAYGCGEFIQQMPRSS
jgi:hypothetical protein